MFKRAKLGQFILRKIIEMVPPDSQILRLKGTKFDFGWGFAQTPLRDLAALFQPPADPIPALCPPGLETTCLPKYVSLNPPMWLVTY